MTGLKFIAVVLLVGAISPTQATAGGGGGGLLGGVTGGLDDLLNGVTGGILGDNNGIISLLKALVKFINNLDIPKIIDDVVNLIQKLALTLKKILDAVLPGLGKALYKIITAILQIVFCDLDLGGILGELLGGSAGSSTPKICQKGFCPEYGLGGNITLSTAKKVMSEGCDEGYEHWDKMKGYSGITGLLKIVLHLIENLLDLGEKCKDSDYVISLEDLAKLFDYLTTFFCASAKHYNCDSGLLSKLVQLVQAILGELGFSASSMNDAIADASKGNGLDHLGDCFNK